PNGLADGVDAAGRAGLGAAFGGPRRAVGGDGPPSRAPGGDGPVRAEAPRPVAPGGGGAGRRTPPRTRARRAGERSGARRRGCRADDRSVPGRRYPDRTALASGRSVGRLASRAKTTGGSGPTGPRTSAMPTS